MAIGTPILRGVGGAITTAATGSFTPSADSILIASVSGRRATGSVPNLPTISDTSGLTWTEIRDTPYDSGAVSIRLRTFWAQVGSSPVATVVSAAIGNAGHTAITVFEVSGATLDFANVNSGTDAAGDPTATLGTAPASTSAVVGIFAGVGNADLAVTGGFTELYDEEPDNGQGLHMGVAYQVGSAPSACAWTSTNTASACHTLELKAPVIAPVTLAAIAGGITTCDTPSFTPAANATLIAYVCGRRATTPALPTISDTSGLTWTEIRDTSYDAALGVVNRVRCWWAKAGASPAATVVTGTVSNAGHTALVIAQVLGGDLDFSNQGYGTDAAGDPSATLPTPPLSNSTVLSCAVGIANASFSVTAGFTTLYDEEPDNGSGLHMGLAYQNASAPDTVAWTSTNTTGIAFILEIKLPLTKFGGGVLVANVNLGGAGGHTAGTIGTPLVHSTAAGVGSAVSGSFVPTAGAVLIAMIGGKRPAVVPDFPTISDSRGLVWREIRRTEYDDGSGDVTRLVGFYALPGSTPAAMTVTGAMGNATATALTILELTQTDTDFGNTFSGTNASGDPAVVLPATPSAGSGIITCAMALGTGAFTPPAGYTEIADFAATSALRMAAGYSLTTLSDTHQWNSGNGGALAIAFAAKPAGATKKGGGGLVAGYIFAGVGFNPSFSAYVDPSDIIAYVNMGGVGGREFVKAPIDPGDPFAGVFRGLARTVHYEVSFDMGGGSKWVVTPDVRAITINRTLNTWPGNVEAGTADFTIDNDQGIYSPLNRSVHGGALLPNLPIDIIATIADADTSLVSSYYLFRGLVDGITVDPAPAARTIALKARDYWKRFQLRDVATSMMVQMNVGTVLALTFDAASITADQRSIDPIADIIPYAWFRGNALQTVVQEFVAGAGYASYVTANGIMRVRDRYFDVGAKTQASYDLFAGLNWSIDDAALVNQIKMIGKPRVHVTSQQIISNLANTVIVPASASAEFFLTYVDPRNQQPGPARNVVTVPVASVDYLLNTNSAGSGTYLHSTCSVRVYAFGDAAKVSIFNGNGVQAYVNKFQILGEPVVTQPDITIEDRVDSSQALYGLRDKSITTRLFTTPALLERRAQDVLELWSSPQPMVAMTQVDPFPTGFTLDLGNVITVTNSYSGFFNENFTVYGISHEIRADDVGLVHQLNLTLQQVRALSSFILDTDQLDIDRLGR